jgi:hypothetical protein
MFELAGMRNALAEEKKDDDYRLVDLTPRATTVDTGLTNASK